MAIPTSQQLDIARLYTALFNRAPDANGFGFWLRALESGASLTTLAQSMMTAPEAVALYPAGQTDAEFVGTYYASVFGRAPDAGGLAFWTAALAAQGGAGNPAARAALTLQIGAVASTPLTSKPDGMSDAAYAQTVADRARFINKTEFGVYFAADLKSNDLALAKSTFALVTDDPASVTAATNLAQGIVDTPAPIPPLVIEAGDLPAVIAAKFAAYPGTTATVEATGMITAQLVEVARNIAKVAADGITGNVVLMNDLSAAELTALLSKLSPELGGSVGAAGMDTAQLAAVGLGLRGMQSVTGVQSLVVGDMEITDAITANLLDRLSGGGATVIATNASATELATLASRIDKLAVDGITGMLTLTRAQTAAELTALLGTKTAAAATVNVDATDMTADQLDAVAAGNAKVDTLTNLQLVLATTTDTVSTALLGKAAVNSATVVATDATPAELTALAANFGKVVAGGITGTLTLTAALSATELAVLLSAKMGDATATVTVNASGMDTAKLEAVGAGITKVDTLTNLPHLLFNALNDDAVIALLGKATQVSATTTGASTAELSALAANMSKVPANGIDGVLELSSALTAAELTALLGPQISPGLTTVNVDASGMTADQFAAVVAGSAKLDNASNLPQLLLGSLADSAISALLRAAITPVSVSATGASANALSALATYVGAIAVAGITGTLNLSNAQTAAELTALLGAQTGDATASVMVNAAGMDVARIKAIAGGTGKIDTLLNLPQLVLSDLTDTEVNALLTTAPGTNGVTVLATGATFNELTSIFNLIDRIAPNGITGTLELTNSLNATMLGTFLGSKVAATATVNVDATGMGTDQLGALSTNLGKVDSITNLDLKLADLGNSTTENVLTKAAASSVRVIATGNQPEQFTSIANHIDRIATDGITGTVALSNTQTVGVLTALLSTKTADAANVEVNAAGMDSTKLEVVGMGSSKVDSLTNLPLLALDALSDTATAGLLGKAANGTVTVSATGASNVELASLATSIDKIAAGGITNTLALSNGLASGQITALLGAKTGDATATVSVDATSMDLASLKAIAAGIGKVDSLTNLPQLVLGDLTDAETSALLSKVTATDVTVLATGATAAEVASLVTNAAKIAADGITGDITLTNVLTDSQLTTFLGGKVAAAATVTVDATSMTTAQLEGLGSTAVIAKTDSITGLAFSISAFSSATAGNLLSKAAAGTAQVDLNLATSTALDQTAAYIANVATGGILNLSLSLAGAADATSTALLSKAAAGTATVVATGASATEVTALLGNLANVADAGITGALSLSYIQYGNADRTTLKTKLATPVEPVLRITGTSDGDVLNVAGWTGKIRVEGGAGADAITLNGAGGNMVFIGSKLESRSTAIMNEAETGTTNIDTITGMTGTDVLRFSSTAGAFGTNITFGSGTSKHTYVGGGISANTLGDVWGSVVGAQASDSANARFYLVSVTGGSLAGNRFLILNDHDATVNGNDTMIAMVGSNMQPVVEFAT